MTADPIYLNRGQNVPTYVVEVAAMSKKRKKMKTLKDERGEYRVEWYFVNGKQRSRKVRLFSGIPVSDFIERNADDIYLVQEGMYEIIHEREMRRNAEQENRPFGS